MHWAGWVVQVDRAFIGEATILASVVRHLVTSRDYALCDNGNPPKS